MNGRFVVRGTILALVMLALVAGAAVLIIGPERLRLVPEPTPPRPRIDAPRGEMPAGSVGLLESAQYGSSAYTVSLNAASTKPWWELLLDRLRSLFG